MEAPRPSATIDLSWDSLSADITHSVSSFLTTAFSTTQRPNFLGEIKVGHFSFGDTAPECEILEIRDVYKEFLGDDEVLEGELEKERERQHYQREQQRHLNERRAPPRPQQHEISTTTGSLFERGSTSSSFDPTSSQRPLQRPRPTHLFQQAHHNYSSSMSMFSPGLGNPSFPTRQSSPYPLPKSSYEDDPEEEEEDLGTYPSSSDDSTSPNHPTPSSSSSPSLQIHLRVTYAGNLSLSLSTSLLINYPSSQFMSLPLSLSLTSLDFRGIFLIAYEGDRRRVHISLIPDDEDPDLASMNLRTTRDGMRLIKSAVVESEVGQGDKHVLKNVGKVEKFVLDVVRSSLENELVFPNFQTILF